ncbi:MAG: hypothetical protein ACJ78Q_09290 [Chloroflexia bacterium]|jgi:hypothetical protein
MYNSYYLVEQMVKDVQTQRRTEAENYNRWSRVRKAIRNLNASRKVR